MQMSWKSYSFSKNAVERQGLGRVICSWCCPLCGPHCMHDSYSTSGKEEEEEEEEDPHPPKNIIQYSTSKLTFYLVLYVHALFTELQVHKPPASNSLRRNWTDTHPPTASRTFRYMERAALRPPSSEQAGEFLVTLVPIIFVSPNGHETYVH